MVWKIIYIISSIACGAGAYYLIKKTHMIDVTIDKKDSRQKWFDYLW